MGTATARRRKIGIAIPDGLLQAVPFAALQEATDVRPLRCRPAEQNLKVRKGARTRRPSSSWW
jgi:hypothetical protein